VLFCFDFCVSQNISKRNGWYKEYYENGQLKTSGVYEDGEKMGVWRSYYETGELSEQSIHNPKTKESESRQFYKNGVLKKEAINRKDLFVNRRYYENGKLFREETIFKHAYKEYYQNGVLKMESIGVSNGSKGIWKHYYPTGEIEWEVNYSNGYREGVYKQYHKNGKLKTEGVNVLDLKQGEEKRYTENGKLLWKGFYNKGMFHKKWSRFNDAGEVMETAKFKKGQIVGKSLLEMLNPTNIPNGLPEQVPIYPGCENALGNFLKKKCMSIKISSFIKENYNVKTIASLNLKEKKHRILLIFKVNKQGEVTEVRAESQYPLLTKEAVRTVHMLPKMTPGKQFGETISVPYSLPINIQIDKKEPKRHRSYLNPININK
jgi:antitoxin component YwqK of YwqJK toxin-antitoxin module